MEEAEGSVEATSEPVVVASAGASRIEGGVAGREGGVASLVDKVLQRLHSSEGGAGGRKTAPVKAAKKTAMCSGEEWWHYCATAHWGSPFIILQGMKEGRSSL